MNNVKTIDIKIIAITVITIYMLTSSLYMAIFSSRSLHLVVLLGISSILLISELNKNHIYYIKKIDIFFLLSIFTILISTFSYSFSDFGELSRPLSLCFIILFSLMIRVDIQKYKPTFLLIKWAAVFISLSVLFSYLFPNLYQRLFLNFLSNGYIEAISQGMRNGYYTGFTAQVAYTAGYILQGIGVIFCAWMIRSNKVSKKDFFILIIMILGLLFTQKRAHLLFLALSCLLVYIQFSSFNFEKIKKFFKASLLAIIIIIPLSLLALTGFGDTIFLRLIETYQEFVAGEDITSNRWPLWMHAIEIFKQNPIFGIGWENFSETVVGRVTIETEMETHNVYLQLLSETGLIGFLLILSPIFVTYIYTLKATRYLSKNKQNYNDTWLFAVLYSLFTQTFFLLYGITGNPLYDYSYFTMYFIAVGIIYSFKNYEKFKKKISEV